MFARLFGKPSRKDLEKIFLDAINKDRPESVPYCMKYGFDFNKPCKYDYIHPLPLASAIFRGSHECALALIEKGNIDVNKKFMFQGVMRSYLSLCLLNPNSEIIMALINHGANLNEVLAEDSMRPWLTKLSTCLWHALALFGFKDIIEKILANKFILELYTPNGSIYALLTPKQNHFLSLYQTLKIDFEQLTWWDYDYLQKKTVIVEEMKNRLENLYAQVDYHKTNGIPILSADIERSIEHCLSELRFYEPKVKIFNALYQLFSGNSEVHQKIADDIARKYPGIKKNSAQTKNPFQYTANSSTYFSPKLEPSVDKDPKNYFKILAMDPDTPENVFERTLTVNYHKAAKKLHPDKGGSDAKFQLLHEAFTYLKDQHNRATYKKTF